VSCNFCRLSTPRDLYKGPLWPSLTSLALQNTVEPVSAWVGSTSDVDYLIAIYTKRCAGFYNSDEYYWMELNKSRILSNPQNSRKFLESLDGMCNNRPQAKIATTEPEIKAG
jgi:hypothetical protein